MKRYSWIIGLAVVAIINAAYLSYKAYYAMYVDPLGLTSICDVGKIFSCSDVLRHPLSRVFGVPFPWIALGVYPAILALASFVRAKRSMGAARTLQVLAIGGVLFNGFIISREFLYIHSYCILCLLCTAIIIAVAALATGGIRALRTEASQG